jgi:hypothetical protein
LPHSRASRPACVRRPPRDDPGDHRALARR